MSSYPLSIQLKLEAIDAHRHIASLSLAEAHNVFPLLSIQLKREAIDRPYTSIPLYPYTLIPLSPYPPAFTVLNGTQRY